MNRRNFILMKNHDSENVFDISCEAIYMQYMSIQASNSFFEEENERSDKNTCLTDEPSSQLENSSVECLFFDLKYKISACTKLRILDSNWIVAGPFGDRFEEVLRVFKMRGGKIEFV